MTWPLIDRPPVRLTTLPGHDAALWDTLVELCDVRPGEWTLVGGQMVFLHALEHAARPPRVSTDLDVVVNARVVSGAVALFAAELEARGFVVDGMSPEGLAHRYRRGGVSIDVLAPDGLGSRTTLTTTPPGRTLQVPGWNAGIASDRAAARRDRNPHRARAASIAARGNRRQGARRAGRRCA